MAGELDNPWQQIIFFLFFLLLGDTKCMQDTVTQKGCTR